MGEVTGREMSFAEHLDELRFRLLKSVIAVFVCGSACYFFWKEILSLFTGYPLSGLEHPPELMYTNPTEAFMVSIKIALFGGLFSAIPIVLYQVWRFIAPGLFHDEQSLIVPVVFFTTIFFVGGVLFCYFLVLPVAFNFLLEFSTVDLVARLSINIYIGFIVKLLLAFGLVFEMPIFSFILTRLGIITPGFLVRQYKYAIVIIFIISAILTPPDVFSQTLMAAPLLVLYGLSIGVSYCARRKK